MPPARLRGSVVRRLVQYLLIPSAALGVLAWGWLGVKDPPVSVVGLLATPPAAEAGAMPSATVLAGPAADSLAVAASTPSPSTTEDATGSPVAGRGMASGRATPSAAALLPLASPTPTPVRTANCTVPSPLPPPFGPTRLATTGVFDLRQAPGLSCETVRALPPGTVVRPRSGVVEADSLRWILVEVEGETGWVAAALLAEPGPGTPVATAGPPTATTTAGDPPVATACAPPSPLPPPDGGDRSATTAAVNLRSGPGLTCGIIQVLGVGTEVVVRSGPVRADGRLWLRIEAGGATGWAAADFLREIERGGAAP